MPSIKRVDVKLGGRPIAGARMRWVLALMVSGIRQGFRFRPEIGSKVVSKSGLFVFVRFIWNSSYLFLWIVYRRLPIRRCGCHHNKGIYSGCALRALARQLQAYCGCLFSWKAQQINKLVWVQGTRNAGRQAPPSEAIQNGKTSGVTGGGGFRAELCGRYSGGLTSVEWVWNV